MRKQTEMSVDGLLIVDKPEGMISLDVVKQIKRRFHVKKAGHIGTLDPFATGVLPVVMNEGTKLVPFLEEEPKVYDAVLKLGEETTTDDFTGRVVFKGGWKDVTPERIHAILPGFLGKIQQVPPMFSALKVKGKPLYQLARQGIEVERKSRVIEIFSIEVRGIQLPEVHFRVSCSKGTYIRTLAKDIGRRIGCGATLLSLRRIRSGLFVLEWAIPWERLMTFSGSEALRPWLISLTEALPRLPELIGNEQLVRKLRFGRRMSVRDFSTHILPPFEKGEWLKLTSPVEGLVAILRSEVGDSEMGRTDPESVAFQPLRVFQQQKMMTQ